ncbi:MAG: hypothetical protein M9962_14245 [Oligoflexia bacterium]|nr:hypothetical protein [Oligoflexia bacterium]
MSTRLVDKLRVYILRAFIIFCALCFSFEAIADVPKCSSSGHVPGAYKKINPKMQQTDEGFSACMSKAGTMDFNEKLKICNDIKITLKAANDNYKTRIREAGDSRCISAGSTGLLGANTHEAKEPPRQETPKQKPGSQTTTIDDATTVDTDASDVYGKEIKSADKYRSAISEERGSWLDLSKDAYAGASRSPNASDYNLSRDQQLIQQAENNYRNSRKYSFNEDDANKASHPLVKETLSQYARSGEREMAANEDYKYNLDSLNSLNGLANKNKANVKGFNSLGESENGLVSKANESAYGGGDINNKKINSSVDDDVLVGVDSDTESTGSELEQLNATKVAEDKLQKEALARSNLKDKIRDALARKLASVKGKENELSDSLDSFSGELAASENSADFKDSSNKLINDFFNGEKVMGFTLPHSGTDAYINDTIQEFGDSQVGILGTESETLFVRVKKYHDHCVETKCVSTQETI